MIYPSFWEENWLEVVGLLASAIGTIAISALRVGTILFISELALLDLYTQAITEAPWLKFLLNVAPTVVFVAGTFGFEGYLFSAGMREGKDSGKVKISGWGIGISFVVTMSSGLLSSMGLNNTESILQMIVKWIVIASTGVGAPAMAYFGAYNIGVMRYGHEIKTKGYEDDYYERMDEWEKNFRAWDRKNAIKIWGVERRDLRGSKTQEPIQQQPQEDSEDSLKNQVIEYLQVNNLTADQVGVGDEYVVQPKDIADALGLPNSDTVRVAIWRLKHKK